METTIVDLLIVVIAMVAFVASESENLKIDSKDHIIMVIAVKLFVDQLVLFFI